MKSSLSINKLRKTLAHAELEERYYIAPSAIQGKGLFAKKKFLVGDIISQYPYGNREDLRPWKQVPPKSEFAHNAIQVGFNAWGEGLYLAVPPNHPRSFLNHSCNPNAGLRFSTGKKVNYCALLALLPIAVNEEITIDYSTTQFEEWSQRCRCHQAICRRKITEFGRIPPQLQDKYMRLKVISLLAYDH